MSIDPTYLLPGPVTTLTGQPDQRVSTYRPIPFEQYLTQATEETASTEITRDCEGEPVFYVDLEGYNRDSGSATNWSATPREGYTAVWLTGRGVAPKYDLSAPFIPEYQTADGTLIMGLDRGPGDGSTSMLRHYGKVPSQFRTLPLDHAIYHEPQELTPEVIQEFLAVRGNTSAGLKAASAYRNAVGLG